MMKKQWTSLAFAGTMALALMLTGCGTNGYYTDPNGMYGTGGYNDPYGSGGYGSDPYGSGGGYSSDPYGSGGSYNSGSGYDSGGYGSGGYSNPYPNGNYPPQTTVGAQLVVDGVNKKKSGILFWKKVTVSGEVKNNTQSTLSGELQISFTKGGKVVETQYEFVTDLAPGQTHSFEVTAKKSSDDADVSVDTQQDQGTPPGYNTGYGSSYGSSYGSGYGSSTGSSYGSGYDSSYGSGSSSYPSSSYPSSGVGVGY
jgi:hypothetical protein